MVKSWLGVGFAAAVVTASAFSAAPEDDAATAALASLDDYMAAFNARDPKAWADTLHFPHVRVAGGDVRVWDTKAEYVKYMDFGRFIERTGWDHSVWDSREVIQSSESKVHIAVQFSRFNSDDEKIATYESFYVLTKKDGRWGTQARSSFAP